MALVAEVSLPDASALPPVEGAVEIALRRTARQWLARVAAAWDCSSVSSGAATQAGGKRWTESDSYLFDDSRM